MRAFLSGRRARHGRGADVDLPRRPGPANSSHSQSPRKFPVSSRSHLQTESEVRRYGPLPPVSNGAALIERLRPITVSLRLPEADLAHRAGSAATVQASVGVARPQYRLLIRRRAVAAAHGPPEQEGIAAARDAIGSTFSRSRPAAPCSPLAVGTLTLVVRVRHRRREPSMSSSATRHIAY